MNDSELKTGIAWRMALLDFARQRQQEVTDDQIEYFEAGYAAGAAPADLAELRKRLPASAIRAAAYGLLGQLVGPPRPLSDADSDDHEMIQNYTARGIAMLLSELLRQMGDKPAWATGGEPEPGQASGAYTAAAPAAPETKGKETR